MFVFGRQPSNLWWTWAAYDSGADPEAVELPVDYNSKYH